MMLVPIIAEESDTTHQGALSRCLEGLCTQIHTSHSIASQELLSEATKDEMHFSQYRIHFGNGVDPVRLKCFCSMLRATTDLLLRIYGMKMLECFYLCLNIVVPAINLVILQRPAHIIAVRYVQNKALSRESICDDSLIVRSKNDLNRGMADGCTPGFFFKLFHCFCFC